MKRSEINAIMRDADDFIRSHGFHLPPFAYWTPEVWATTGDEAREIVECDLGWDITDFGSGNYEKVGLFLFTIRNGHPENLKRMRGKLYCEKLLISDIDQVTPMHFHWHKTEDIINRGGGNLVIQLYNAAPDERLCDTAWHRENPQSMFGFPTYCLDFAGGETVGFFRLSAWRHARPRAGVVELADTGDLKSPASQGVYGFKSRLRHDVGPSESV